ncbi:MAG: hypothetical protein KJS66_09755 [Acidobacteria bacterium]|nr:hypothetical protein [Acidobacteriota bacterium]
MTTTYESATADLIDAIDKVVEGWLVRVAETVFVAGNGALTGDFRRAAQAAARDGATWTMTKLHDALEVDVDAQRVNPLQILRDAVRFPTELLVAAGIPAPQRDEFDVKINPDDVYGIGPAHWNDIDESLTEPGIIWGAAKASTVLQRRRAEGKLDPR